MARLACSPIVGDTYGLSLMLSVKLLPSNSEILKLEYLGDEEFEELLVICPSPQKADGVRSHLQGLGRQVDVLTISKFIKDCMGTLGEDVPKVSRKSELLLKLSTIWKIKYPELSYDIFTKAFNLYTELRGFSLNLEMLEDVLAEEEESMAIAIRFFWLVSEELGLFDEHYSYGYLTEEIRSLESPTHEVIDNKMIVFMGFKHLSGGQLDLLKSIGIRAEVIIPIHQDLYKSADTTSWVGWLDVKDEIKKKEKIEKTIPVHRFKKGRFSEEAYTKLNELLDSGAEIYLPSNTQEFQDINVLPAKDLFYKSTIDPFKPILTSLVNELKVLTDFGKIEIEKELVLEALGKVDNISKKKDFYFRWLKVKSQFIKLFNEWEELSEANKSFSFFDTEVFEEILDLDLPRNYLIPIFDCEPKRFVNSLDNSELNSGAKVVLLGGSFLGPLKGGEANFSELQLDNLISLGPVRSSELDFVSKKVSFQDLVESTDVEIMLEDNFEESDISWLELLENVEVVNNKLTPYHQEKINILKDRNVDKSNIVEKLSATSLQAYLDCPRKYYFKYIEKININPKVEEGIRPFQLGIIEHEVIGKFFDNEEQDLNELSVACLNKLLAKENIQINSVQYQEALFEIVLLASRGINFVKGIRSFFGKGEMEFERTFSDNANNITHRGSVDFFYKGDEGFSIIDFKRSASGIPKVGEFQDFSKIQTWYYLNHINCDSEEMALLGYLNLKDPSASLLYTPSKELRTELKKILVDLDAKVSHLKEYETLMAEYIKKENELVEELKNDDSFSAKPLDAKSCLYCPVGYVCERGKL